MNRLESHFVKQCFYWVVLLRQITDNNCLILVKLQYNEMHSFYAVKLKFAANTRTERQ